MQKSFKKSIGSGVWKQRLVDDDLRVICDDDAEHLHPAKAGGVDACPDFG